MGLQCAFQPVLTGHLSITASFLGPKGDHYRQVALYLFCVLNNLLFVSCLWHVCIEVSKGFSYGFVVLVVLRSAGACTAAAFLKVALIALCVTVCV